MSKKEIQEVKMYVNLCICKLHIRVCTYINYGSKKSKNKYDNYYGT